MRLSQAPSSDIGERSENDSAKDAAPAHRDARLIAALNSIELSHDVAYSILHRKRAWQNCAALVLSNLRRRRTVRNIERLVTSPSDGDGFTAAI